MVWLQRDGWLRDAWYLLLAGLHGRFGLNMPDGRSQTAK